MGSGVVWCVSLFLSCSKKLLWFRWSIIQFTFFFVACTFLSLGFHPGLGSREYRPRKEEMSLSRFFRSFRNLTADAACYY